MSVPSMPCYVAYTDPAASMRLANRFGAYFNRLPPRRRIVVVCIGTDRCTGDSLGPLTGTLLSKYRSPDFEIYGTLEHPVHAMNLADTMDELYARFDDPFIIGIDACLGQAASIGAVLIGDGPLRPGAGVNKELPPVGDIHVSGVVNIGGLLGYQALQTTRLHLIMSMSGLISRSLLVGIRMSSGRAIETPAMHGY
ncbi:spore protease YyaC [Cohnella terricola]|uniref:Spore protease YyaC n=1 Tax=Cohnella terricola TaxID=1289167 RepID=A0A559JBZ4_9BACL|nr:spore protease YyaC [Cohnella terricola]TVX97404.1 spore protease YyaC [Cohnella terricola]